MTTTHLQYPNMYLQSGISNFQESKIEGRLNTKLSTKLALLESLSMDPENKLYAR